MSTPIDGLLAALDDPAVDPAEVLPVLADALEEAGDPSAAGVRWCLPAVRYHSHRSGAQSFSVTPSHDDRTITLANGAGEVRFSGWKWVADPHSTGWWRDVWLPAFRRLTGGRPYYTAEGHLVARYYDTRSAAFLALAQALAPAGLSQEVTS